VGALPPWRDGAPVRGRGGISGRRKRALPGVSSLACPLLVVLAEGTTMINARIAQLPQKDALRTPDSGMALIEIMIVLALIALIASTIGVAAIRHYREGQVMTARIQVRDLSSRVGQFVISRNQCPTVDDLVAAKFVEAEPRDPWGTAVSIRCPGEHDPDGADVLSFGPDKQEGTGDDIKSWKR
jgi:general secretion pathway protein G